MDVGRQGVHVDNLAGQGAHDGGGLAGAVGGHVLPVDEGGILQVDKVAVDADGGPGVELGGDMVAGRLGLETERVAAKVDGLFVLGLCGCAVCCCLVVSLAVQSEFL